LEKRQTSFIGMDNPEEIIKYYELLLSDLIAEGPTESWEEMRRRVDTILAGCVAKLEHHDLRAQRGVESILVYRTRNAINQAIELKKHVDRERENMI
jgi:hypothetical protein